ncbi:metacaspase-3-like isoform X1 [Durio zibethinus]|uniref:Metacaspase-3-like isoform X1 n=1 Tax=Durio zibethinus TaxID=66656 RepID=A0A6P6AC03_DURZI|nr:metacaspase-3-like isoform X1 [Durio zibethinus]
MTRRERCSGCGLYLLVPPEARTIRCAVCQAITNTITPVKSNVRANVHWGHLRDSLLGPDQTSVQRLGYDSYPGSGTHGIPYVYAPHQRPPQPRPPLSAVSVHGRKRALLCGVNYHGKSYRLKGSINDVKCMRYLLIEKLGFPNDSILMLTEDETDPFKIPTKQNIRKALRWLVYGCQSGDSLVFHFSGHGTRQIDYNQDEVDGYDEALCPLDHETEGIIIDDEINDTIVRPLPREATLHAIIDACYSGTVLDLPFVCRMNKEGFYIWEDQRNPLFYKGTSGGLAFCFSACDDNQVSADTTAFTGTNTRTGAMTFSFIQAVQNEPGLTYGRLLNAMRNAIRDVKAGLRLTGPIATLINKVLFGTTTQEPQLSSSEKFDIYSKQFVL